MVSQTLYRRHLLQYTKVAEKILVCISWSRMRATGHLWLAVTYPEEEELHRLIFTVNLSPSNVCPRPAVGQLPCSFSVHNIFTKCDSFIYLNL